MSKLTLNPKKQTAFNVSYEEMDRLMMLLTATSVLAAQNGNEKIEQEAADLRAALVDLNPVRRMQALEMQRVITNLEGRSYLAHSIEKVKNLLEID